MTYSKKTHKYLVKKLGKNYHNYPKCVKYYLSLIKGYKETKHVDIRV